MPPQADEQLPSSQTRRKRRKYQKALIAALGMPLLRALFLEANDDPRAKSFDQQWSETERYGSLRKPR